MDEEVALLITDYLNGLIAGFNASRCTFEIAYLQPEQTTLELLHSWQTAGELKALIHMHLEQEATDFLLRNKVPMSSLNADLTRHHVPSVIVDNVRGYAEAWKYVEKLGHVRVVFLGYCDRNDARRHECAAGREVARISSPPSPNLLVPSEITTSDPDALTAFLLGQLGPYQTKCWPTLFFTQTDLLATHLINALQTLKISVPENISVIGFNDTPLAKNFSPQLTTLAKPRYQMAFAASLLLVDILARRPGAANRLQVFYPDLVQRETCAPASR